MTKRLVFGLLLGIIVLLMSTTAASAAPKWKLLGTSTARFQAERDEISVGAGEGIFDALQLRVRGSNLTIFSAHVNYASGVPDQLEIRQDFKKDESTRVIALPGRGRLIRNIILIYRSQPSGNLRPATIAVWGRRP